MCESLLAFFQGFAIYPASHAACLPLVPAMLKLAEKSGFASLLTLQNMSLKETTRPHLRKGLAFREILHKVAEGKSGNNSRSTRMGALHTLTLLLDGENDPWFEYVVQDESIHLL